MPGYRLAGTLVVLLIIGFALSSSNPIIMGMSILLVFTTAGFISWREEKEKDLEFLGMSIDEYNFLVIKHGIEKFLVERPDVIEGTEFERGGCSL